MGSVNRGLRSCILLGKEMAARVRVESCVCVCQCVPPWTMTGSCVCRTRLVSADVGMETRCISGQDGHGDLWNNSSLSQQMVLEWKEMELGAGFCNYTRERMSFAGVAMQMI